MCDRLVEHKCAINTYVSEADGMQHIHAQRWILMEDVFSVLRPFKELTRESSAESVCMSTVLATVMMLRHHIHNGTDSCGIKQMKTRTLTSFSMWARQF